MKYELVIGRPDAGRKIDRVAAALLDAAPYSLIRRLLRNGKIRINGKKAKGGEIVDEGDIVTVHHSARREGAQPEPVETAVYSGPRMEQLYWSDDYIALNKPAGVRCSEDDRSEESVQAWLRGALAKEIADGRLRPELCHRLDRGTTGVVLVALSASAVTRFHEAAREGRVQKSYCLLAWGRVPSARWTVDRALVRRQDARPDAPKVVVAHAGSRDAQPARTEFTARSQGDLACFLGARLLTGRTHQIRAHLRAENLFLIGDPRYGDAKKDLQKGLGAIVGHPALHAEELSFPDAGSQQTVKAPLPEEFREALRRLNLQPH